MHNTSFYDQIAMECIPPYDRCRAIVQYRMQTLSELTIRHERLFNLARLIDTTLLRVAGEGLKVSAAAGVDQVPPRKYRRDLLFNIIKLHKEVLHKSYQPSPARRVSIDKDDGSQRHLGLPTTRDKHLQRAVLVPLEAIYEPHFHPRSYGFRRRRSARMAMQALRRWLLSHRRHAWVLELDLAKFFDTIPHDRLLEVVARKVGDKTILKLIKLWLKAGVMVDGILIPTECGAPQGGVISPMLANIYLNHVLDQWLTTTYFPSLKGRATFVRYADDVILAFTRESDAQQAIHDLTNRLAAFGLTVNPTKTKLTDMRIPAKGAMPGPGPHEVNFLGFTYYWKPCPETGWRIAVRTSDKSIKRFTDRLNTWLADSTAGGRDLPEARLKAMLKGHREYFEAEGTDGTGYLPELYPPVAGSLMDRTCLH